MDILLVKNMVCPRCLLSVEDILNKGAIPFHTVRYGEIHLNDVLNGVQKKYLSENLKHVGFELIDSQMSGVIEKIKILLIKRARNEVDPRVMKLNISAYLSEQLHYEYTHLSSTFSALEGRTIENFFIEQRIKRAKELLDCGQMTLSEIAYELEYSSTAYFSTQFKKITGYTPSYFKEAGIARRSGINKT